MNHKSFPWIVSSGTLRLEDLLPAYWQTAEELWPLRHNGQSFSEAKPKLLTTLEKLVGADSSEDDWSEDDAHYACDDLFDILNELAPVGFSFGASEGDGACFGFWLLEDWIKAMEDRGLSSDDPAIVASLISQLEDHGIDADNLSDAYQGEAQGRSEEAAGADFAQSLAQEFGYIDFSSFRWPFTCIDWEDAWRELVMDDGYFLIKDPGFGAGDYLCFCSV